MIPYIIGGGSVVVLAIMLACVRELFAGCPHQHLAWPQRGVQRCLSCGGWRLYAVGEKPGPWQKAQTAITRVSE